MNFSSEYSRPDASAEIERMSAAGKVILNIMMAMLRVSWEKLGANTSVSYTHLTLPTSDLV